ncbi:sugar ABC transporter substrate-binding protein [Butyrivibrio sp. XBB1001]|uniref:sugar ABC transporter substrate-binding protein n=1 Tax=Butyrivibrio sp. XBB1001 TaxID=1280682 RepID=UPI002E8DEAD9|nr:substrate-binding domain-containing protein [Butyrivibrio sp. XBB1001]
MMGKYKIGVIVFLLTACILGGCGNTSLESVKSSSATEDKVQIGMCFDSFVIERWQRDRDVFVSAAKERGAEVNVQNANGDPKKQKEQIEYFIKKGMDVIVIISIDPEVIADSVKKAQDEGIKVIAYDRPITGAGADLYISFDNEMVGEMMGQALVDSGLKNGKVVMICGSPTDKNVPMVCEGFERVMEENGNEILDVFYADGWKAEAAGDYVYSHPEIIEEADAVMCGNDDLASKVVYALSEKRLAGKKLVVGQDADLEACQRIVEGTQLMTVYKPIEKLAGTAAEAAVAMALGEPLDSELYEYDDGKKNVPYLKIETISVSADNMDEVIVKSGFHLKEDIYLNVPDKASN